MEMKDFKDGLKKHRRLLFCLRAVFIYGILLYIATHSGVFEQGITKSKINAIVILVILVYRLICLVFVPATLVLWLFDINKRRYNA